MNIAFCVNAAALIGLGPTLSSLIRNCSNSERLNIYILCAGLTHQDKKNLTKLLHREVFQGVIEYIDFDPTKEFGHLRSLHGDWTAYGRLLLPELLQVNKVLYLDADLVVEADILDIQNFDFQENALAAVSASKLKHALDNPFLHGKLGMPLETPYFNSGVLYIDLQAWRDSKFKDLCLTLARKYPTDLISHDQTLLNAFFGSRFTRLNNRFNCPWYAHSSKPSMSENVILHFLGSPKPWDVGASVLHRGYKTWKSYLDREWAEAYNDVNFESVLRLWKLKRSYIGVVKKRFNNRNKQY